VKNRRVVITGLGFVTTIGLGVEEFWKGILAEKSGIGFITRFDTSDYYSHCAGEITNFHASDYFPPHKLKRLDRYSQFALLSTQQALQDAKFPFDTEKPRFDVGVSFGTALGGIANAEVQHERFLKEGARAIPPALALQVFGGAAHSNIAINFGFRGYGTTNSNSCASGTVAVGEAFRVIRDGYADFMVAGAAEAPLCPLTYGAFDVIKAMCKEDKDPTIACRPFDKGRTGFVMGEGAAALFLETLESAQARGATIYAEVIGYTLNNDAYHMTCSLPGGASTVAAMQGALEQAKLKPSQIDYINAHASSTPVNDDAETQATIQVFGEKTPAVSGTKAYYSHPLGASGAIEAGLCSLALKNDYIPPTLNCTDPIVPEGFDLVRLKGRKQKLTNVMSNSFGFGGINSSLILTKAPA
jgi:3-oxoacyl-[acyl-carrier-protein] synthase II